MGYKEKKKELNDIQTQIQNLQNEQFFIQQEVQIESYIERSELIGKCFKKDNYFCKIIDLAIDNPYRCMVLSFTQCDFNIEEMFCHSIYRNSFTQDISNFGKVTIGLKSMMIRDIKMMKEINSKEFQKVYINQCYKILNINDFLKNERLMEINEKRKEIEENFKRD